MKMTQAWGWLAAGVLAAGLNASYHDGGLEWAHQVVDRVSEDSQMVLALASGRADQFLTQARMVVAQNQTSSDQLDTTLARIQTEVQTNIQTQVETKIARSESNCDRLQALADREQAREQARLDRFEAKRARIEAQIARIRIPAVEINPVVVPNPRIVLCPRVQVPRVQVNVPRMPIVKMPAIPVVHIETLSTGSI